MQADQSYLLIFPTVRGQLTALTIKNESIRTVPAFHNVETFMNLTSQILRGQVAAQKDCFDSPTELSQGLGVCLDVGKNPTILLAPTAIEHHLISAGAGF